MRLSEILPKIGYKEYSIRNEKEFDCLALSAMENNGLKCMFLDDCKYMEQAILKATMILTTPNIGEQLQGDIGVCICQEPRQLFFELHNYLVDFEEYKRKQFKNTIGIGCKISPLSSIAENNVKIGNNVIIEEFVVVRENTVIGDNSIIRAGTVIGGQGFEFKRQNEGIMSVKHIGGVIIGNDVEIQYNTTVDKAIYPWDNTELGDYTKIDNLVHIAHGVKIQSNVMIVANSGIGGRTVIGANSWIGFAATIINGIEVSQNARVNIGAVVTKAVGEGKSVSGNFAISHEKFIRDLKGRC